MSATRMRLSLRKDSPTTSLMSMYCNQESLATTIACGRELSACLTRSKQLSHTERNERVARVGKAVCVVEAEETENPAVCAVRTYVLTGPVYVSGGPPEDEAWRAGNS
jgi:uncharacterized protein YhfF